MMILKLAPLGLLLFSSFSFAYEMEEYQGYFPSWNTDTLKIIKPLKRAPTPARDGSRIRKFNLALDALKIPREPEPDLSVIPASIPSSSAEINERLKAIDPELGLRRYLDVQPTRANLFYDFFSSVLPATFLERSLGLQDVTASPPAGALMEKMRRISAQAKDPAFQEHPLQDLTVVIDPGHMGTDYWDHETGKYVTIGGVTVSEGDLNLWTSYLLANELEALGAKVTLTRQIAGTVTNETLDSFNDKQFLYQYFYNSLDDWMAPYLNLSDEVLKKTIALKAEVKQAYTANKRESAYFIAGADLEARAQIIDREKPDVVIDVHYDANLANQLQSQANAIEAFVPGGFMASETGARSYKAAALRHLVEMDRWAASVDLASSVVNGMAASENIPLQNSPTFLASWKVQPGVYARNLYITRRNLSSLMIYLECLHYDFSGNQNRPINEFKAMSQLTETGNYRGVSFQYPARVRDVVTGIKAGFLNYFQK